MGMNYYFKLKEERKQNLINNTRKQIPFADYNDIEKSLGGLLEIHIGKTSVDWKPLFQATKFYSNIMGLQTFYEKHKDYLKIVNECDKVLSWEELKEELFNHKGQKSHLDNYMNIIDDYYMDYQSYEWCTSQFF